MSSSNAVTYLLSPAARREDVGSVAELIPAAYGGGVVELAAAPRAGGPGLLGRGSHDNAQTSCRFPTLSRTASAQ